VVSVGGGHLFLQGLVSSARQSPCAYIEWFYGCEGNAHP
jgi:hypothetical protein